MASSPRWAKGTLVVVGLLVGACGGPAATAGPSTTPTPSYGAATTPVATVAVSATDAPLPAGTLKLAFVGLTDGGTVAATMTSGHPLVRLTVRVSGGVGLDAGVTMGDQPATDAGGRALSAINSAGADPFTAGFDWMPLFGGGEYDLTATSLDENKTMSIAKIHITVTGVPHATLPPAMTRDQALTLFSRHVATDGISIPQPSMQRFDFPTNPTRSRWIVAAYYRGHRYYGSFFDDGHTEWADGSYADPAHQRDGGANPTWCRPAGHFRVLVVFVDYKNTGTAKSDALAQVPVVTDWLNALYRSFATSGGNGTPPMTITSDAAYIDSPPSRGQLLTPAQILSATGKSTSSFDFVMQVDLDKDGTYAAMNGGYVEAGGGLALHNCEPSKSGPINIWSSVTSAETVRGGLVMDFNHEFSHLFGMMDDWPGPPLIAGPADTTTNDWIPYVIFGWSDTDGDGIPEIVDPTPYGTTGPQP
jgi:hypothetical protein